VHGNRQIAKGNRFDPEWGWISQLRVAQRALGTQEQQRQKSQRGFIGSCADLQVPHELTEVGLRSLTKWVRARAVWGGRA
jgi:hypothetical protein